MPLIATAAFATTWTMILAGDVMLNGITPSQSTWSGIQKVVRGADVAIANLEIPWTTSTRATTAKSAAEVKARNQFILKADPGHAPNFASAGWDIVSLANNHAMDYGWGGLSETQKLLTKHNVVTTGAGDTLAASTKPAIYVLGDGTKVGVIGAMAFMTTNALGKTSPASATRPGVHGLDLGGSVGPAAKTRIQSWVNQAKRQCDVLVVGLHWGTEKRTLPNAYQVNLGRAFIDAGASIVWGHHPHVLQGAEFYRGRPIFYSAGNLISPMPGTTALFELTFRNKRFAGIQALPVRISGGKVTLLDGKAKAAAMTNFTKLCQDVQRAFPNRNSTLPTPPSPLR